jgi:hypothetical protein
MDIRGLIKDSIEGSCSQPPVMLLRLDLLRHEPKSIVTTQVDRLKAEDY